MAVVGLVSDTHMPERCAALPPGLFDALRGVDVILHAGDVGELWVLDQLSASAPVVAVHGNDDTVEAQRELPYQQVVAVGGVRVLACHSHNPDREQELAQRRTDELPPKLARIAAIGAGSGARVVVFGHWHIPLFHKVEGVALVNPGAIGTPNATSRMLRQTVARMHLRPGDDVRVEHVDVAAPSAAFSPDFDPDAGFKANAARFSASILEQDLARVWDVVRAEIRRGVPEEAAHTLMLGLAWPVWRGERDRHDRRFVARVRRVEERAGCGPGTTARCRRVRVPLVPPEVARSSGRTEATCVGAASANAL